MDSNTSATLAASLIIIFSFILIWRYINFRETIALADRGLVRPERARKDAKNTLRWGIIITALGLALCIWVLALGAVWQTILPHDQIGFVPWLLIGLIPLFFGLALILIYVLTRDDDRKDAAAADPKEDADDSQAL